MNLLDHKRLIPRQFLLFTFFVGFITIMTNCAQQHQEGEAENTYHIIPKPLKLEQAPGVFKINAKTRIEMSHDNAELRSVAYYLNQMIGIPTGFDLNSSIAKGQGQPSNSILLKLDDQISNDEGYLLTVSSESIVISGKEPIGIFYGVQTLRQLLPVDIDNNSKVENVAWTIPNVHIEDEPRFVYRGMHLDVGRHFFPVSFIKKYIDMIAMHKMNTFHWHLTEDQGWRIEIKKYPKLTEIGAYRKETLVGHYNDQPHKFDGKRYGGYYTQEEVKEIVQYAKERFVTIIPEIEMPGHSLAALAAYPELGCTEGPFEVATKWGIFADVYCPSEKTFEFLQDVLTEVIELFPGTYIHIGGDESPKERWKESQLCQDIIKKEGLKDEHELQSYFIKRIETFLQSKNRRLIGWDEILEGGLAPDATVMSWRGIEGGIAAAKEGHDVIMTPTSHCYFDYYQSNSPNEPLAIGGFLPLEKVYGYEPIPEALTGEERSHVLGAQGNIWTEYMNSAHKVEYMAFPRAVALAEVVWSSKESRDYKDFVARLGSHLKRFDKLGVNFANHIYDVTASFQAAEKGIQVTLNTLNEETKIYYTLDGKEPNLNSNLYKQPFIINEDASLRAVAFNRNEKAGNVFASDFNLHQAAGRPIELTHLPHESYNLGGKEALINGVKGSNERYGDREWLGFSGKDFEGVIDLGENKDLSEVNMRFFNGNGQWIYLPSKIEISISDDGQSYTVVGTAQNPKSEEKVHNVNIPLINANGRYLKIHAQNYGLIPDGRQGAGNEAWLFVDEITVN
ncbi:glycoside hydrolase family 20 protein [Fulvivirgaceae bacterium BMA10]|uniref:beta-N-acetylhexosaminidase n=1 Tax=Splendidivirga corallicola TaxID=3051826 RepID=A0ABT8KPH3_9BACT|nr:glycoside hydrolase family 20 protein [Fulvivirgaceae bacterium BMA10]